jgi:hypothetical protein
LATGDGNKAAWLPGAATALAVISCYGSAAALALLSLLGISIAIDQRLWAGAIALFAALAAGAITVSFRRHHEVGPVVLAGLGLGLGRSPNLWHFAGLRQEVYKQCLHVCKVIA